VNALSNPENNANTTIKMSTARIKYRKYKSMCEEKHEIQPKNNENCNDRMKIYIVNTVGILQQKHNIPPELRKCITYKMKKLRNVK
jgi:hypothetical protein